LEGEEEEEVLIKYFIKTSCRNIQI